VLTYGDRQARAYGETETGVTTTFRSRDEFHRSPHDQDRFDLGHRREAAIGGNWTVKGRIPLLLISAVRRPRYRTRGGGTLSVKNQEQIFRGGINYRFGAQLAAVGPTLQLGWLLFWRHVGYGIGRNDSTFVVPAPAANGEHSSCHPAFRMAVAS